VSTRLHWPRQPRNPRIALHRTERLTTRLQSSEDWSCWAMNFLKCV